MPLPLGIPTMVTAIAETFRDLFKWKTGGRTLEDNKDADEMRHWHEEESKALRAGDLEHAGFARRQLFRLQQRAFAKSGR